MADPVQTGIDPTTGYPIFTGDPQIVVGHRAGWTGMQPSTVDQTNVVANPTQYNAQWSDVPGLIKEQAQASGRYVQAHPGQMLAAAAAPMLGVPEGIAAGLAGYAFDSMHPFTNQAPDYQTQSAKDYILNGLTSGILNGFGAGGKAAELTDEGLRLGIGNKVIRDAIPEPNISNVSEEAVNATPGMASGFVPPSQRFPSPYIMGPKPLTIPSEDIGAIPGYQVPNYAAIPGAEDLRKRIIDEGKTQYMPAADAGNPWLGDQMVGNPEWMTDPRTPEGQNFRAAMAQRNPQLPLKVYSGLRSGAPYDPEAVGITSVDRPIDAEFGYRLNENGLYEIPKWTSDKPIIAGTYAYPPKELDDDELRDMILDKIKSGVINENNYPKKLYSSINEMIDALEDPNQYSRHMANTILSYTRDLAYIPRVQEFIPFASNPRLIDKQGKGWATALPSEAEYDVRRPLMSAQGGRPYQAGQIYNAMLAGNDALVYQNQIDAGMALANRSKPVEQSLAMSTPSDVLVALDHSKLKYPYNMGLWNLKDIRPLAAIPLGLGAGLGAMYNKGEANGK